MPVSFGIARCLQRIIVGLPLLVSGLCALIAIDGLRDEIAPSDVAIVLGSKVLPGGQASPRLAARLDAALGLYRDRRVRRIIVSGGTGVEGYSESRVMRDYLAGRGVPAAALIEDPQGVTTWATAKNSAAIMRRLHLSSAIVVSQYFHIPRTRLAMRAQGIGRIGNVHARIFEWRDLYSTLREIPALVRYWWRTRTADG